MRMYRNKDKRRNPDRIYCGEKGGEISKILGVYGMVRHKVVRARLWKCTDLQLQSLFKLTYTVNSPLHFQIKCVKSRMEEIDKLPKARRPVRPESIKETLSTDPESTVGDWWRDQQ